MTITIAFAYMKEKGTDEIRFVDDSAPASTARKHSTVEDLLAFIQIKWSDVGMIIF